MTGNLDMMVKFRDLQVAEAVGKKAALGWFDMEFTMYGCAYLNPQTGKMCFRVSEKAEDIFDFVELSSHRGIFASNVVHLTKKYPVPSGMKNLISQDVKKMLAYDLKKQFPSELFLIINNLADTCKTDNAFPLLAGEVERLEGMFEEDQLENYFDLVNYCHSHRCLTDQSYLKFIQWYKDEMKNLADNSVSKDIFETTMYGIGYEENGNIKYLVNANQERIYSKVQELELKGCFVGPVMARQYWYNYEYRLPNVIQDFKGRVRQAYPQALLQKLQHIIKKEEKEKTDAALLLADAETTWSQLAVETFKRYMIRWGLI